MRFIKEQGCARPLVRLWTTNTDCRNKQRDSRTMEGSRQRFPIQPPPSIVNHTSPANTTEQSPMKFFGDESSVSAALPTMIPESRAVVDECRSSWIRNASGIPLKIPASMKSIKFSAAVKLGITRTECRFKLLQKIWLAHVTITKCFLNKLSKDQATRNCNSSNNAETDLISIPIRFHAWSSMSVHIPSLQHDRYYHGQEPSLKRGEEWYHETVPLLVVTIRFNWRLSINREISMSKLSVLNTKSEI